MLSLTERTVRPQAPGSQLEAYFARRWRSALLQSRVAVILGASLFLHACVFHQPYPPPWSPSLSGCEGVSGRYADLGERFAAELPFPYHQSVVSPRSLSGLLLRSDRPSPPFTIELRQLDRDLDIRFWVDQSPGSHYRIPAVCDGRGLRIELQPRWRTATLSAIRYWGTLYLTHDADGNLIGQLSFRHYGAILLVPVVGNGTIWYRFAQAPPI